MSLGFFSHLVAGFAGGEASKAGTGFMEPVQRGISQTANKVKPNLIPSPQELLWCYRTQLLNEATVREMLSWHGICFAENAPDPGTVCPNHRALSKVWQQVYRSQNDLPGPAELLVLRNRDIIKDDDDLDRWLGRRGMDFEIRKDFAKLRFEIPGIADLTRFAVRHIWEPDLIEKFGYDDEYRPAIEYWMGQQGFSYDFRTPDEKDSGRKAYTPGQAQWWAHWILPSPGQGYEMLQRLRPTGGKNGGPRNPNGVVFDHLSLEQLLRANDYPPYWRNRLIEISYRPIGVRQINQLAAFNLADEKEFGELWQDAGYRPDQSKMLARLTIKTAEQRRWKEKIAGARSQVLKGYEVGTLTFQEAAVELYRVTLDDPDQVEQFNALDDPESQRVATQDLGVQTELAAIDVSVEANIVKTAINEVRKAYLTGKYDRDGARAKLNQFGINPARVTQYMALWDQQKTVARRELSASQIMRMYRESILDSVSAATRLINLQYPPDAVVLLLQEVARNIALDQAKAAMQAAKTASQRQKANEQAIRATQAEIRRQQSELSRQATPNQLADYVVRGYIPANYMANRLALLSWTPDNINLAVEKAIDDRNKKISASAAKAAKAAASEAASLKREAAAARKAALAPLLKLTLSELSKMLLGQIETQQEVEDRLHARGWDNEDITDWFELIGYTPTQPISPMVPRNGQSSR